MWRGAVNRQPGYRARNLQRRGRKKKKRKEKNLKKIENFVTNFFRNFFGQKPVSLNKYFSYRETSYRAELLHVHPFHPTEHQKFKDYARGPAEIQSEAKNRPKILLNSGSLLEPFGPGGVLLTEGRILSSASYVGRRGKPSTWLPRQKLAEERKKEKEKKRKKFKKNRKFRDQFFSKFFWSKTGFVEQIFLISGDLVQS